MLLFLFARVIVIGTSDDIRQSFRFKDHHSGKLIHLYSFTLLISNSWDTETNHAPESLIDNSHFPVACGLSMLAGKTEELVAIPVTSDTIFTARVCRQLIMVFTTNHLSIKIIAWSAYYVEC